MSIGEALCVRAYYSDGAFNVDAGAEYQHEASAA